MYAILLLHKPKSVENAKLLRNKIYVHIDELIDYVKNYGITIKKEDIETFPLFKLSDEQSKLANLSYDEIEEPPKVEEPVTTARLASDADRLERAIGKINSLVGLESVKNDIKSLVNLQKMNQIRKTRGIGQPDITLHLVFSGNPGTGKTTVARLLAEIYVSLGLLSKGHLVEVDRSGLVGGYLGQTALKVNAVLNEAKGGILFIDEAYALDDSNYGDSYGQEAITALLKGMEDNRDDLVVIVAGYPQKMIRFLQSNPGLKSRFNKFIEFSDYSADEMTQILLDMCTKYGITICDEALDYSREVFRKRVGEENFANARDVRNYFEKALVNQADRLMSSSNFNEKDISVFTLKDMQTIQL